MFLGKGSKCKRCRLDRCLEIGLKADKVLLDEMQRKKYTGMYVCMFISENITHYFVEKNFFFQTIRIQKKETG